jgi:hypothetical protein
MALSTAQEKQGFMESKSSLDPKHTPTRTWNLITWAIRYGVVVVVVGTVLAIPMIIFRNDQIIDDTESLESLQYRNLVYYLFAWFEITWLAGVVTDMFIPHIFWLVSR